MCEELVGQDGGVGFYFDQIDGEGGDFGVQGAAERVGEAEGGVLEYKVDRRLGRLGWCQRRR